VRLFSLLAAGWLCLGIAPPPLAAQIVQTSTAQKRAADPSTGEGQNTFTSVCAPCHGRDGRGGKRAKNIATSPRILRLSDAALRKLIQEGNSDKGMPSFRSLGEAKIKSVVGYLHTLQRKALSARNREAPRKQNRFAF